MKDFLSIGLVVLLVAALIFSAFWVKVKICKIKSPQAPTWVCIF